MEKTIVHLINKFVYLQVHIQKRRRKKLTLESNVSISDAMFSNTCSSSKRGTSSALTCLTPAFIPSLLNATSFASISFSRCLACFLKSATSISLAWVSYNLEWVTKFDLSPCYFLFKAFTVEQAYASKLLHKFYLCEIHLRGEMK